MQSHNLHNFCSQKFSDHNSSYNKFSYSVSVCTKIKVTRTRLRVHVHKCMVLHFIQKRVSYSVLMFKMHSVKLLLTCTFYGYVMVVDAII